MIVMILSEIVFMSEHGYLVDDNNKMHKVTVMNDYFIVELVEYVSSCSDD